MKTIGICIGASTISLVELNWRGDSPARCEAQSLAHGGNPGRTLADLFNRVESKEQARMAVTGRKFRNLLNLSTISEPEAVEQAMAHAFRDQGIRTVISAGGETFVVYALDRAGKVAHLSTGNKCASGTGEFLLQQLGRMGIGLGDLDDLDPDIEPCKVSGRCSVFCKSDCTHALNKGMSKDRVVAGLAHMMAGKCLELMKRAPKDKVLLIGGCSLNRFMVRALAPNVGELVIHEHSRYFEALGAALWAKDNDTAPYPGEDKVFRSIKTNFSRLESLDRFQSMVEYKSAESADAHDGDEVVVGLDVGSTTTKGVVMRVSDREILAGEYLRTGGDPVAASRNVYRALDEQFDAKVNITGLGVTGSGRAIAGLHAGTEAVINEIIAHATAAVHYDQDVDTIFEIGGQDAKYTYIVNKVPCDYAMNGACSAGTGSFLEESAKETLGVDVRDIGPMAFQGQSPPNFNDQCAAFISSDILLATQESMDVHDILAGLSYSICMNYANRVRGARPVGRKVFMQGGVCYNKAVPAAMAALTGKRIIVPPDPGLMGAFGVALETAQRMEKGLLEPGSFDLSQLAGREVRYKKPFICNGGAEKCDIGCEIARIEIDGKVHPFGGVCNRWENQRKGRKVDTKSLDLVAWRQKQVYQGLEGTIGGDPDGDMSVGLNRSFLVNTYFPLFNEFFKNLGVRVILPDKIRSQGVDMRGASFCHPAELSHGYMAELLAHKPDYIFLPHMRCLPGDGSTPMSYACVLVQGEPYYLKSVFPELRDESRVLSPVVNMGQGLEQARLAFLDVAERLGKNRIQAEHAFARGVEKQNEFFAKIQDAGSAALDSLSPDDTAVVLFGRPYNAFSPEANKGVPSKFSSKGVRIIPHDMLPMVHDLDSGHNMYWALGQIILKAAKFVAASENLFGAYLTNFSCGPDSFLLGYFRDTMGKKPSLTLEVDSHTADAGIETRVEAFLDIVAAYRAVGMASHEPLLSMPAPKKDNSVQGPAVRLVSGRTVSLKDPKVRLLVPSMGRFGSELVARALGTGGYQGKVLPSGDESTLKLGRGNTSCKECLPLQLTMGSMLNYMENRDPDEISVYVMPSAGGPCRFGQYNVFASRLMEKKGYPRAAVFSPTSLDAYGGLGEKTMAAVWRALLIGDAFEETQATLLTAAKDRGQALADFERELALVADNMSGPWGGLKEQLDRSAKKLSKIPLVADYREIPKLSLVGEIFVRHDPVARQGLVERMADAGFILRTSPIGEWMKYTDWLILKGIEGRKDRRFMLKQLVKGYFDRVIFKKLRSGGLVHGTRSGVDHVVGLGRRHVSEYLTGEAILTVGSAFHEIGNPSCGILSIGPFGCMPSRVAEAVLSERFTTSELALVSAIGRDLEKKMGKDMKLPFLAIETDGQPFPQLIEARLDAFLLQASRLNSCL